MFWLGMVTRTLLISYGPWHMCTHMALQHKCDDLVWLLDQFFVFLCFTLKLNRTLEPNPFCKVHIVEPQMSVNYRRRNSIQVQQPCKSSIGPKVLRVHCYNTSQQLIFGVSRQHQNTSVSPARACVPRLWKKLLHKHQVYFFVQLLCAMSLGGCIPSTPASVSH